MKSSVPPVVPGIGSKLFNMAPKALLILVLSALLYHCPHLQPPCGGFSSILCPTSTPLHRILPSQYSLCPSFRIHVFVYSPQQGTATTYIPRLTTFLHAECSHFLKLRHNRPTLYSFQVSNIMIWYLYRLQSNFFLKYYFGEVTPLLRKSLWLPIVSQIKSRICLASRASIVFFCPLHSFSNKCHL